MRKKKHIVAQVVSMLAVLAMVIGLAQPASLVKAEDTGDQRQMEKIESIKATFVKGADDYDGKHVWNAKIDADDHRFVFRVDYSMSGVKDLPPGAIKLWIPKTIFKDRSGKYADYTDISYPSEDEYRAASEEDRKDVNYTWKESTDEKHKNCIEITNVKERTAGENGYFEVAYITNEQTFEYQDYDPKNPETGKSDPFYADIQVTNDGQTVTGTTDRLPVYINTTAEISSTNKRYPDKLYRTWQSSLRTQPKSVRKQQSRWYVRQLSFSLPSSHIRHTFAEGKKERKKNKKRRTKKRRKKEKRAEKIKFCPFLNCICTCAAFLSSLFLFFCVFRRFFINFSFPFSFSCAFRFLCFPFFLCIFFIFRPFYNLFLFYLPFFYAFYLIFMLLFFLFLPFSLPFLCFSSFL